MKRKDAFPFMMAATLGKLSGGEPQKILDLVTLRRRPVDRSQRHIGPAILPRAGVADDCCKRRLLRASEAAGGSVDLYVQTRVPKTSSGPSCRRGRGGSWTTVGFSERELVSRSVARP